MNEVSFIVFVNILIVLSLTLFPAYLLTSEKLVFFLNISFYCLYNCFNAELHVFNWINIYRVLIT